MHIPECRKHKHNHMQHCKAQISPYDLRSALIRFTVWTPLIYLAAQTQASHVHHRVLSCNCPKQEAPRPLTHDSRKAVSNRSLMTACLSGLCWATAAYSLLWGSPAMCSSNHLRTALLVWTQANKAGSCSADCTPCTARTNQSMPKHAMLCVLCC